MAKKETPKVAPKDNKLKNLEEREARVKKRLANIQAKIKELK